MRNHPSALWLLWRAVSGKIVTLVNTSASNLGLTQNSPAPPQYLRRNFILKTLGQKWLKVLCHFSLSNDCHVAEPALLADTHNPAPTQWAFVIDPATAPPATRTQTQNGRRLRLRRLSLAQSAIPRPVQGFS